VGKRFSRQAEQCDGNRPKLAPYFCAFSSRLLAAVEQSVAEESVVIGYQNTHGSD